MGRPCIVIQVRLHPRRRDDHRCGVIAFFAEVIDVGRWQGSEGDGTWFGVDLTDVRLEATDSAWGWGTGQLVRADSGSLVALLSGRALPDGRGVPRR